MIEVKKRREPWIDFLRAIASLAVVFFHLNEVRNNVDDLYSAIVAFGWLGVPVFFVVSGYCVMRSSLDSPPASRFLLKRIIRVFPPYWASLVVVCAVIMARVIFAGQNDVAILPKETIAWIATATLATNPVSDVGTLNWVYWTLSYEVAFYLVMSAALVWSRLFMPAMIAITTISLALFLAPFNSVPGLFFLDYWPLFTLGVGLALWSFTPSKSGIVLALLSALATVTIHTPEVSVAALLTAISIPFARTKEWGTPKVLVRLFSSLGEISYSLYLIHVPVGVYLLGYMVGLSDYRSWESRIGLDILLATSCIVFAYAMNRAIERPTQNLSRGLSLSKAVSFASLSLTRREG